MFFFSIISFPKRRNILMISSQCVRLCWFVFPVLRIPTPLTDLPKNCDAYYVSGNQPRGTTFCFSTTINNSNIRVPQARSSLFRNVTHRRLVVIDVSGQPLGFIYKRSAAFGLLDP